MQQLEVEAAARELEGFKGFKRLKPGSCHGRPSECLNKRGLLLFQAKGRLQFAWTSLDGQELGGSWPSRDVQAKGRLQPWNST